MNGHPAWFGLRQLVRRPLRLAAATAAVAAAVLIIAVEAGFLLGILDSQARFADQLEADLVLIHRTQTSLDRWNDLPSIRPWQAGGVSGVTGVAPIYRGGVQVLNPVDGRRQRAVVLAVPPDRPPLAFADRQAVSRLLRVPGQVLFDRLSRDLYGEPVPGDTIEIDDRRYRVGGRFAMGPNLVYDGVVLMSAGDWVRHHGRDDPLFVAITIAPEADREVVRATLARTLPDDIVVLTPAELRAREVAFTVGAAPIGLIFGLGALLGVVVGAIFTYQVLHNEVSDCRAQFTTLRAMGFGQRYLAAVVVSQSLLLALLGSGVGLAVSALTFQVIAAASHMAMQLTLLRALGITALAVVFCLVAGLAAVRVLTRLEPAELL